MADGREIEPSRLRVSDQERYAVAEVLRQAAGDGRIDLEELDERLEAAYAAKTYADLVPLTADLPVALRPGETLPVARPVQPPGPVGYAPTYPTSIAVMSETRRTGVWRVAPFQSAFALMGSVVLDLRHAAFSSREVTITANAIMGSVDVVVDQETHVVVDGVGIMGDFSERTSRKVRQRVVQGAPVVVVKGVAFMGSVTVRRAAVDGNRA